MKKLFVILSLLCFVFSCSQGPRKSDGTHAYVRDRLAIYEEVELKTDLNRLTENEKDVLVLLIRAAQVMDRLFWKQVYPNRDSLLRSEFDENTRQFFEINYGPWDRLNDNKPFVSGIDEKPPGSGFYPADMTKEELLNSDIKDKLGPYSLIRRSPEGNLVSIPYHVFFKDDVREAAQLLLEAAKLTSDDQLRDYLARRATALTTDQYTASDSAWLMMKDNRLDIIIGPIENYEDALFNARTSYESYVLVKDEEWSRRLERYVKLLPSLQQSLPVEERFKSETPGISSQLAAYDVVYYAGEGNSGGKTIAVNLPNDEKLQEQLGTRRSQLKNTMRAKFDKILIPIVNELIDKDQRKHVNFDSFFANVMFHEVAHGLGVKNTINSRGTVRQALQEQASWLEEGKADILGLYMVARLLSERQLEGRKEEFYTTFMAGLLRSVRFGAASAHGKANMLCFNFFKENGAFTRTEDGFYRVDYRSFEVAMNKLSGEIIRLQANGDKGAVEKLQREKGVILPELQNDLDRLTKKKIPVDLRFKQGIEVLGL